MLGDGKVISETFGLRTPWTIHGEGAMYYTSLPIKGTVAMEIKVWESLEHKAMWEGLKSPRDIKKRESVGNQSKELKLLRSRRKSSPTAWKKTGIVWCRRHQGGGFPEEAGGGGRCYVYHDGHRTLSVMYLTGALICSFFSCRWESIGGFHAKDWPDRKCILERLQCRLWNIEFGLRQQKPVHPFWFLACSIALS